MNMMTKIAASDARDRFIVDLANRCNDVDADLVQAEAITTATEWGLEKISYTLKELLCDGHAVRDWGVAHIQDIEELLMLQRGKLNEAMAELRAIQADTDHVRHQARQ